MAFTDAPRTEAEVLEQGRALLTELLPAEWILHSVPRDSMVTASGQPDGVFEVVSPDGVPAQMVVEIKRSVQGRDVDMIHEQLQHWIRSMPGSEGLVAARYLSPPVRERLADAGVSYVDATGNVRVTLTKPGLFISHHGADRDPWRGPGRPRGTLKGAPAARVVRALLDFDRVWSVRELVEAAGVSTGSAYRVIQFIEEEGLITKQGAHVRLPDWVPLLRRWSREYGFVSSSRVTRWLAPRGLEPLLARVAEDHSNQEIRYAVTGTVAAAEWAAYAPARSAMIYTADAHRAAEAWDLRPVDAGANVMLAEPESDVVFTRTLNATTDGQYTIAAPTQVAVDLLTGPGRSPSEAEELIDWMARNEGSWRLDQR